MASTLVRPLRRHLANAPLAVPPLRGVALTVKDETIYCPKECRITDDSGRLK